MTPDITIVGNVGVLVRDVGWAWEVVGVDPGLVELAPNESIRIGAVDVFGPALVDIQAPAKETR